MSFSQARAFAPASVGNVAVGFDLLGHAIEGAGDTATVRRIEAPEVRIAAITGTDFELPLDPPANTAGRALIAMREALGLDYGFEIEIEKGIALGSGMGGSAASAVAALVAANALLDEPLRTEALYPFALEGEAVASGGRHGDNIGPMLLGGLVLALGDQDLIRIPVPQGLTCCLVHPDFVLETRRAREALRTAYALSEFVAQSSAFAGVLSGCWSGDLDRIGRHLHDVLVEPRRAPLIPGFAAVQQAALDAGALGASISGAGPSVFAWFADAASAKAAAAPMQAAFREAGLSSQAYVSPVDSPAARVLSCSS
jgi:homoserine kinase